LNVLIIGGTGLISTAITREMKHRGHRVAHFNRGRTPDRTGGPDETILGDRKDYASFEAAMSRRTWDCVIDMAAYHPDDARSVVRAFSGRIGHFVFCSTVCVYGGPLSKLPATEDEPRTPVSDYGRNKAAIEDLLLEAHENGDFPVTIVRPSQTYGEGGVIVHSLGTSTTFLDRIRKGRPVVVHGDGHGVWAACHIDDVALAFAGAAGNPSAFGRAYHAAGDVWMTWNDYVRGVGEALGREPKMAHIPTEALARVAPRQSAMTRDIFQYPGVFDNTAAKRDLGFAYTVPWVEGVRRTAKWLDEAGKVENCDEDPFPDRLIDAYRSCLAEIVDSVSET
jgi:nucleoside-diphosphate-sugar epimerase